MQGSSMRIPDSGQPDHQIWTYFPIKSLKTGVFPINIKSITFLVKNLTDHIKKQISRQIIKN